MMKRLNYDASTHEEAQNYLESRAKQLLKFDVSLLEIQHHNEASIAIFEYQQQQYQSVYMLEQFRGQGFYSKLFQIHSLPVLVSYECQIEEYLKSKAYPYLIFRIEDSAEYQLIQQFYGDRVTERSGAYLMNHIDEGLAILAWIGASDTAKRAYCLHPILQADEALYENYEKVDFPFEAKVLIAAMEYRSVANAYLSKRKIQSLEEIRLSPLKEVNDMLIADKIQNRKDFEIYHLHTHPRSKELNEYFKNWCQRLGISESLYQSTIQKLV